MQTYKTYCFIEDDAGPTLVDTIWHKDAWWLVATWYAHADTGHRMPQRIVRMGPPELPFEEVNLPDYRFVANNSVPIAALEGSLHTELEVDIHPMALAHIRKHGPDRP